MQFLDLQFLAVLSFLSESIISCGNLDSDVEAIRDEILYCSSESTNMNFATAATR